MATLDEGHHQSELMIASGRTQQSRTIVSRWWANDAQRLEAPRPANAQEVGIFRQWLERGLGGSSIPLCDSTACAPLCMYFASILRVTSDVIAIVTSPVTCIQPYFGWT